MSPSHVFPTIALVAASLLAPISAQVLGYVPTHSVHDVANLGLDLATIGDILATTQNEDTLNKAYRVYAKGGHSTVVASVELLQDLPFAIAKGTTITGTSTGGQDVTGVTLEDYDGGARAMEILYAQDHDCFVGGLDTPVTEGCFVGEGTLFAENGAQPLPYFYSIYANNAATVTLQTISRQEESEFTLANGAVDTGSFAEFQKFEDFYGTPTYADDILEASFKGSKHNFDTYTYDFQGWSVKDRAWMAEKGPDYLNVVMHMVGQLEKARNTCFEGGCGSADPEGSCQLESLLHLDQAVAFYTGTSHPSHPEQGQMLYALADQMCVKFKTCGWSADTTVGTSRVNLLSFGKFNEAQTKIRAGQCAEADLDMRIIAKMIFVPLWQGLLDAAYHGKRREGTVFSTATLPLLAHCTGHAHKLVNFLLPDATTKIHFNTLLTMMQDHYHCTMLDCNNIGGLWNAATQTYVFGDDNWEEERPSCRASVNPERLTHFFRLFVLHQQLPFQRRAL
jgi:hypothetical protein